MFKVSVLADSHDGDSWESYFHGKRYFCQLTPLHGQLRVVTRHMYVKLAANGPRVHLSIISDSAKARSYESQRTDTIKEAKQAMGGLEAGNGGYEDRFS